jgi:hypothetical protein
MRDTFAIELVLWSEYMQHQVIKRMTFTLIVIILVIKFETENSSSRCSHWLSIERTNTHATWHIQCDATRHDATRRKFDDSSQYAMPICGIMRNPRDASGRKNDMITSARTFSSCALRNWCAASRGTRLSENIHRSSQGSLLVSVAARFH